MRASWLMFCRHRFDPVVAAALFKASSSPNYIQTNWQQGFGAFWKKFPHMFVRWKLQAVRVSVWPGDVLWKKETSSHVPSTLCIFGWICMELCGADLDSSSFAQNHRHGWLSIRLAFNVFRGLGMVLRLSPESQR
jgi:hypothetical protein